MYFNYKFGVNSFTIGTLLPLSFQVCKIWFFVFSLYYCSLLFVFVFTNFLFLKKNRGEWFFEIFRCVPLCLHVCAGYLRDVEPAPQQHCVLRRKGLVWCVESMRVLLARPARALNLSSTSARRTCMLRSERMCCCLRPVAIHQSSMLPARSSLEPARLICVLTCMVRSERMRVLLCDLR